MLFDTMHQGSPRRGHKASRGRTSRSRKSHYPPRIERLESRCLLAGDAALVADIIPGIQSSDPRNLTDVNGDLYFNAAVPGSSSRGLYHSDGTSAGTELLITTSVVYPTSFVPLNGEVFFGGARLGKTDGTSDGTLIVKNVYAYQLTVVGGKLFFVGADGKGDELWVSDGTSDGTRMVKDIYKGDEWSGPKHKDPACTKGCGSEPEKIPNSSSPEELTDLNEILMFTATDGKNGRELWRSDGKGSGTRLVKDIAPGEAGSEPRDLTVMNEFVYFSTKDGGLWKSDGTEAGTVLVKQFSDAGFLTVLNGELFFAAGDGAHGRELWKSDGTATGTVMVKDIHAGPGDSAPEALSRVGSDLYFTADDGAAGRELWKYDGATGETTLVKDINPGPDSSMGQTPQITDVNGQAYFVADDGGVSKLWRSDGSEAGTVLVPSAAGQPDYSNPDWLVAMNNKLYFTASDPIHGVELWDPPAVESPASLDAVEEQLFVADFGKDSVFRYDASTGAFVDRFVSHGSGGLNQPYGVIFGPDANGDGERDLYVSGGLFGATGQPRAVNRYDGRTGAFIDQFTKGGDLTSPRGIIFTPDGDLLVADRSVGDTFPLGRVARFDGVTGQYEGDFVTLGSGGYALPQGLVFGPSEKNPNKFDLYASSADTSAVLRFDGETGEFLGEFVTGDNGLDHPLGLTFGPDGDLYVVSTFDNPIVARFQGPNDKSPGAFVETFVPASSGGMLNPVALIFGPDGNGDGYQDLYVTNSLLQKSLQAKDGSVKRYDGRTGAFIDTIVATKSGGLDDPIGLTFRHTDRVTLAYTGPDAVTDSCENCLAVAGLAGAGVTSAAMESTAATRDSSTSSDASTDDMASISIAAVLPSARIVSTFSAQLDLAIEGLDDSRTVDDAVQDLYASPLDDVLLEDLALSLVG